MSRRETFDLEGHPFVELCDLLKLTALVPSGGIAKQAIAAGEVIVDGAVELRKRCKIKAGQIVIFEDVEIAVC